MPISKNRLAQIGADLEYELRQLWFQAEFKQVDYSDEPIITFLRRVNELVRNPVQHHMHAEMLSKALAYLMVEEGEPFQGTVEEAMYVAVDEAMDSAAPREQVLLALMRHRASLTCATG